MKKISILAILTLFIVLSNHAQKSMVFAPEGIAIKGYDVVAFFTESKAVKGTEKFSTTWSDAKWLFSNQQNLDLFKNSPDKYAPQYGGYCAYGTAQGHKAPTQTDTWTIVNNKLYFNYNSKVKEMWSKNQSSLIDSANIKWPMIKDKD